MAFLPQDIVLKILSCLRVKDLLRFKCVSKSWSSSIDDPSFIKLHLSRATNSSSFEYGSLFNSLQNAQEIESPHGAKIVGSCNGLLTLLKGNDVGDETWLDKIWLRNPSTRKSQMLPSVEIKIPSLFVRFLRVVYGFGYDPMSDDYKLIRLVQFHEEYDHSIASTVMVYSLSTNSWRRVEDFPFYLQHKRSNGVFVNNALHWVVAKKFETDAQTFVIAFDLGAEKFRVVELPDRLDQGLHMYVKVIEGRLCLITKHLKGCVACNRGVLMFDIWMMKQYGSKQSWTKLMSVTKSKLFDRIRDLHVVESLVPVNSNEDAMMNDE